METGNINSKFKEGNKVRIVKYGSLFWYSKKEYPPYAAFMKSSTKKRNHLMLYGEHKDFPETIDPNAKPNNIIFENDDIWQVDISPGLVGKEGIIDKVTITQGKPQYAISGPEKHAWYNEDQLELVK